MQSLPLSLLITLFFYDYNANIGNIFEVLQRRQKLNHWFIFHSQYFLLSVSLLAGFGENSSII